MPLYYEDLEVGQVYTSQARTVTEADLVGFAMLSGDWNPLHTDAQFAASTRYGQRIVHGIFGMALLTGLLDRAGWFSGSAIALLEISNWRFVAPIFIGDTLHCTMEVAAKRLTSSGDRGIIDRRLALLNDRDETVQQGHIGLMVRRRERPEGGA